jgi:hypothetical protein
MMVMGVFLISISYFTFRHESVLLLSQFSLVFGLYLLLAFKRTIFSIKEITAFAIVLRLLLLILTPNLSEDVYRFLWDGKLWWEGIDAYAFLPAELIKDNILNPELFSELNSPHYYSIYPPLNQLIFWIAGSFDSITGGIITIRIFVILAEIGTLILLPKVLMQYQKDPKLFILYAFNPLVILELSGNLHFEVFVIFFLILAIYQFEKANQMKSALAFDLTFPKYLPRKFIFCFYFLAIFHKILKCLF